MFLYNAINLSTTAPLFFKEGVGEILRKFSKNPPIFPFTEGGLER